MSGRGTGRPAEMCRGRRQRLTDAGPTKYPALRRLPARRRPAAALSHSCSGALAVEVEVRSGPPRVERFALIPPRLSCELKRFNAPQPLASRPHHDGVISAT